jgi:hypothetical protein
MHNSYISYLFSVTQNFVSLISALLHGTSGIVVWCICTQLQFAKYYEFCFSN